MYFSVNVELFVKWNVLYFYHVDDGNGGRTWIDAYFELDDYQCCWISALALIITYLFDIGLALSLFSLPLFSIGNLIITYHAFNHIRNHFFFSSYDFGRLMFIYTSYIHNSIIKIYHFASAELMMEDMVRKGRRTEKHTYFVRQIHICLVLCSLNIFAPIIKLEMFILPYG